MLTAFKYHFPDKYYITKKSEPYASTTVGGFSAHQAIQGDKGFQGRTIPEHLDAHFHKKTLIINFNPLHQDFYFVLYHLLDEGFKIYLFYDGKPQLLSSFPMDNNEFDYGMDSRKLVEDLVKFSFTTREPIRADHILVCNCEEIYQLLSSISGTYLASLDFIKNVKRHWVLNKKIFKGNLYPLVDADQHLFNVLGKEGCAALEHSSLPLKFDTREKISESRDLMSIVPSKSIHDLWIKSENIYSLPENVDFSHVETLGIFMGEVMVNVDDHLKSLNVSPKNLLIESDYCCFTGSKLVESFSNLKYLRVEKTYFIEDNIDYDFCEKLLSLSLYACEFNYKNLLAMLSKFKKLQNLSFENCVIQKNEIVSDEGIFNSKIGDTLTELTISMDSMRIAEHLFKHAKKLQKLAFQWQPGFSTEILTEAHLPDLEELTISASTLTEEQLVGALMLSPKLKQLKLLSCTVEKSEHEVSWDKVALDQLISCVVFGKMPSIVLKIIEKFNKIELLDFGVDPVNISFTYNNPFVEHLKSLRLNLDEVTEKITEAITKASRLKLLDISYNAHIKISHFTGYGVEFKELEALNLSNLKMSLAELDLLLSKMPKLKKLTLASAKINAKHSELRLNKNCLIDLNLKDCTIEDLSGFQNAILKDSKLISVVMNANHTSLDFGKHVVYLHVADTLVEDKLIDLFKNKTMRVKNLYIHNLSISNELDLSPISEALATLSDFSMCRWNTRELMISAYKFIELVSCMKELMFVNVNRNLITMNLVCAISKGDFKYKHNLISQLSPIDRYSALLMNDHVAPVHRLTRGTKITGQVYDLPHVALENLSTSLTPQGEQHYTVKPLFEYVSGPQIDISHIRRFTFKPIFRFDKNIVDKEKIKPQLLLYKFDVSMSDSDSLYKRLASSIVVNAPEDEIKKPWIKLDGLMVYDKLISVSIEGLKPHDYVVYHSSSDGFYYVLFNNPSIKNVLISYVISPSERLFVTYPQALRKIIEPFYRAYQGAPNESFKQLSLKEQMIAVCHHPQYHACGVRTNSFLYAISEIKHQGIIDDFRAAVSGVHSWPEVLYQGVWYTIDLDGAPATFEYAPVPSVSSPLPAKIKAKFELQTKEDLTACLNQYSKGNKWLFVCQDEAHLHQIRGYIRSLPSEEVTVIDSPENAYATAKFISLSEDNKAWAIFNPRGTDGWIKNQLVSNDKYPQKMMLIDWSSFTISDAVSVNSCIEDSERCIDGVPIDPSIKLVGLITRQHSLMADSSFTGRHKGRTWTLNWMPPDQIQHDMNQKKLPIELYHSTQWKDIILGKLLFKHGHAIHEEGPLLETTFEEPIHVILKNPPTLSKDFERFVQDLRHGRSFKYYDKNIRLPVMSVEILPDELKLDISNVKGIKTNVLYDDLKYIDIEHVITPSTFERCMVSNHISADGLLHTEEGWLSKNKASRFYITRSLSVEQYAFLLNNASEPLSLYFAPGVIVPIEFHDAPVCQEMLDKPVEAAFSEIIITTRAPSLDANHIILDISEFTPDDILYGYNYQLNADGKLHFTETVSDVWKALHEGKHVTLYGTFSNEMIDHLSTLLMPKGYLWRAGEKEWMTGKLQLISPQRISSLTWRSQLSLTSAPKKPLSINPIVVQDESERFPQMMKVLNIFPWVLIEGEPGVGKSSFIRELQNDQNFKCYTYTTFDNSGLEAWAKSEDPRINLLIVDEAFMWGGNRTEFSRMLAKKRQILVNKRLYDIADNKKIVFLGNKVMYLPTLFGADFPTLTFTKLTKSYVVNTIIKPIFRQISSENHADAFYEKYQSESQIRTLQDKAIVHCAKVKYSMLSMTTHSYCLTESRLPIFKNIIEVLLARRFKQEATVDSESARYGGKAGCWLEGAPGAGKTKLIKSALDALGYRQYSIDDMYHHSDGTNTNAYYQVPASMNIGALRKHVNYAFQHGLVLKIDEFDVLINTDSAYGEEASRFMAELNAYLMGEDLYHMRPSRPGFILLITGNGIAMSGRELLSDAFRSRIDEHRVPTYRQNECIEILFAENKGLEAKFSNSIDLQSEVYAFIQQYMQNPQQYTFRSLLDDVSALNDSIPSIPAPTSPPVIFSRQVTQRSMSSFGNVRHNKCVII